MRRVIELTIVIGLVLMPFILFADSDVPAPVTEEIKTSATIKIPGMGELAVAGPFVHKNLTFFIFHDQGQPQKEPDYITLEEGVKAGLVKISEDKDAQVRRLLISNLSNKVLFIHVGEIVKGGKQDRTMQTSLVVPPKTKNMPVPSFCVEQSRWSGGKAFAAEGVIVPDKSMKLAVQTGSQGRVWSNVDKYKTRARRNAAAASGKEVKSSKSSSVNEELADKDFRKLISGYEKSLMDATKRFERPRGLATIVDGQISTVDIYHASSLFQKLYPKLLKSAAAEAAAGQFPITPPSVTVVQLVDFLTGAWDGKEHTTKLGYDNVVVRIVTRKTLASQLFFKDKLIHVQILKLDKPITLPKNNDAPARQTPAGSSRNRAIRSR